MRLDIDDHIDESDQLRYVDGELDAAEIASIEAHLAQCLECRDALDDLAAACDSLTAFLNRADFEPRPLAWRSRAAGWWTGPLAKAALLAVALAGLGIPAVWLRLRAPAPGMTPDVQPVVAMEVPRARADAARARGPVGIGSGVSRAVDPPPAAHPSLTIDVTSWQLSGTLRLVFWDSDVFLYDGGDENSAVVSINTQTGLMSINTSATSASDLEIWIPSSYRSEDLTVRVAGREIPFTAGTYADSIQVDLSAPEGQRRRR